MILIFQIRKDYTFKEEHSQDLNTSTVNPIPTTPQELKATFMTELQDWRG